MDVQLNMNDKEPRGQHWTNASVLALAGDSDPLEILTTKVRELVFGAFEAGYKKQRPWLFSSQSGQ